MVNFNPIDYGYDCQSTIWQKPGKKIEYFLFVINLFTQTKGKYRKERGLRIFMFCRTVICFGAVLVVLNGKKGINGKFNTRVIAFKNDAVN